MNTITADSHRLALAALISLTAHLTLFVAPSLPQKKSPSSAPPMEVEVISPEKLAQYRSVGIKNGSKHFSIPVPSPPPLVPQVTSQ